MSYVQPPSASSAELENTLRSDFHWGYATAAAQVEGAWNVDGKGDSIWDTFCHTPGKVIDKSTNEDAVLSYKLFKEDVQLLKKLGVTAYRFSLSWSRIIPLGGKDDLVNEAGLDYYSNLVDELLANGITPFVTLFHWDTPQALESRYKSFLNKDLLIPDFVRYASVCIARLGDRVKNWITFNEPGVFALAGYAAGVHAPGRSSLPERSDSEGDSSIEPFIVGHTQLLAHAHVAALYRQSFKPTQGGQIGITLHGNFSAPYDPSSPLDIASAERALEFEIAWFADPLYGKGPVEYPASMRAQLGSRLPTFTESEKLLVRGSSEFYGMNSYTTFFVQHRDQDPDINDHKGNIISHDNDVNGVSRGPESDTYWLRTCPWGFRRLLSWIWTRYGVPIYVTENGTTAKGETDWRPDGNEGETKGKEKVLDDKFRQEFFEGYLGAIADAVRDGVDIRSYFAWTFTDNWEWAAGYTDRFGSTWIDFDSEEKTRYPKKSAYELQRIFEHLIKEGKDRRRSRRCILNTKDLERCEIWS